MLSAYEQFLELKPQAPLNEDQTTEQSLQSARELVMRVQQKTLSAIEESIPRQMGGMLFAHTLKALQAPQIFDEPKLYQQAGSEKGKTPAILFAIFATGFAAFSIFQMKEQDLLWPMLCQLAALVLWVLAFFLTHKPAKKAEYKIVTKVDHEKLMALIGEQMHLIDRDLEALLSLCVMDNPQEISDSALDAMMKIYEIQAQSPEQSPEISQAIGYYLKQNGLIQVEYTLHNAPMFQALPTKGATRTLVPALLKENRMVRQGLAIVKKEEAR